MYPPARLGLGVAIFANQAILAITVKSMLIRGLHPMTTRNVNLTDHLHQFVEEEIEAGRYRNASEVMRAGLRLLEQQRREDEERLTLLRSLAADAFGELDQGRGIEIRGERQLVDLVARIGRRSVSSAKRRRQSS